MMFDGFYCLHPHLRFSEANEVKNEATFPGIEEIDFLLDQTGTVPRSTPALYPILGKIIGFHDPPCQVVPSNDHPI